MRGLREFGSALVIASISVGLMLGALSISLVEFIPEATPTATIVIPPSPPPITITASVAPTLTFENPNMTVTASASATNTTLPPSPVSCQPPAGWMPITIQPNDTIDGLAARYRVSKDLLKSANCLVSESLLTGTIFYVPPAPTSTVMACIPGAVNWMKSYMVRPGDTLYSIATNHYTSVSTLRFVNCRVGDQIFVGEILWVPMVATRTPIPSPLPGVTVTPHPTDPLTETALPFTVTVQPSNTSVPNTPTVQPTLTVAPTLTASPTAFSTP